MEVSTPCNSDLLTPVHAQDSPKFLRYRAKNGVDTGFQDVFILSRTCLSPVFFGAELFVTFWSFSAVCTVKLTRVKKLA